MRKIIQKIINCKNKKYIARNIEISNNGDLESNNYIISEKEENYILN